MIEQRRFTIGDAMDPLSVSASPSPPSTAAATTRCQVLIVDDSPIDRHLAGAIVNKVDGWTAAFASHGKEALEQMEQQLPDVVLTDLLMPEMDGLQLTQAIRARFPNLPVILMTAHGSEDVAIQALQKGAASYVPKKCLARDLEETLEQLLSVSQASRNQQRILECLMRQDAEFVLDNDTGLVAPLVGYIEQTLDRMKACDPSGLILVGVALHEALTNAILHGNLELDSAMRETDEKLYYNLATERRSQQPYANRRVNVRVSLDRSQTVFHVRDDGKGFDPATLPDPTDPANLGKVSGRGLLLIQTFMDHVEHNARGNEITMVKRR
jgi:CheY-like chemotaxis protein/anti-sigma regulatory factor (Ser/Thr protein kinase)